MNTRTSGRVHWAGYGTSPLASELDLKLWDSGVSTPLRRNIYVYFQLSRPLVGATAQIRTGFAAFDEPEVPER